MSVSIIPPAKCSCGACNRNNTITIDATEYYDLVSVSEKYTKMHAEFTKVCSELNDLYAENQRLLEIVNSLKGQNR